MSTNNDPNKIVVIAKYRSVEGNLLRLETPSFDKPEKEMTREEMISKIDKVCKLRGEYLDLKVTNQFLLRKYDR